MSAWAVAWMERNYLRVRGEYRWIAADHGFSGELPPRARRIPAAYSARSGRIGTTSACAENTRPGGTLTLKWWNYLRVRGEYWHPCRRRGGSEELPPRARRIQPMVWVMDCAPGTTSACAENTIGTAEAASELGNYLRVRGEYNPPAWRPPAPMELPPRARRIQHTGLGHPTVVGTTSACAENTPFFESTFEFIGNYLRVRGEYLPLSSP